MAERTVSVALEAKVTGFVSGMKTAKKAADDLGSGLLSSAQKNKASLGDLANNAGILGAALTGLGGLAVKTFADFEQAMSHVQAATHETADNMQLLRDAARAAGKDTTFSATEAAGAIEELAKAGVSTKDILGGGLKGALDLAAAGTLDVGDAAEIAASAMVQFGLSGKDLPHIADLLAAGAGKAQGSVQDMGLALKYVGPIAAGMGISIEETAGSIALLASNGIIGEQAGTSLRGMLSSLTSPSKAAAEQMKNLGINVYDASGNFVGFDGVAAQLRDNLGGLSNAQRDASLGVIFGNEQLTAARVLYKGGADAVREWTDAVYDQGYATETASLKLDNLKGDLEKLSGSVQDVFLGMGEGANGPLRSLVQKAESAVDSFGGLPSAVQQATLAIAGGGGLALLGAAGMIKLITTIADTKEALFDLGVTAGRVGTLLRFAAVPGAIAAVGVAADQLGASLSGARIESEKLATGLDKWAKTGKVSGETAKFMGGALHGVIGDFAQLDQALDELGDAGFGETLRSWTDRLTPFSQQTDRSRDLIKQLDDTLAGMVASGNAKGAAEAFKLIGERAKEQGVSVAQLKALFPGYSEALKDSKAANKEAAGGIKETGEAAKVAKPPVDHIAEAIKAMDDRAKGAEQSLSLLNATMGNVDAESAYEQAIDDAQARIKEFKEEQGKAETRTKDMKNALELQSQAGRDNAATLRELWGRTSDYASKILETTGNQKQANGIIAAGREQLVNMAAGFLGSKRAAEQYVTETLGIPKDISSKWNTPGLLNAIGNASTLQGKANSLDGKVVNTYFKTKFTEIHERVTRNKVFGQGPGFAIGGLVRGPGTPTSDSIPAWLSTGEFVVNAEQTAKYLPVLKAINEGRVRDVSAGVTTGAATKPFVKLGEVTDAEWEALKRNGWQGKAGDHMEALYPPLDGLAAGATALNTAMGKAKTAVDTLTTSLTAQKVTAEDGSKVPKNYYDPVFQAAMQWAAKFGLTGEARTYFVENFRKSYKKQGNKLPTNGRVFEDGSYRNGIVASGQPFDLGAYKSGGRPVPYTASATGATATAGGDTITQNFYPRSIDLNEHTLQTVTHAARVRARVGRPA